MAIFASEPARELVDTGLHRLAQPLTSALWLAETAEENLHLTGSSGCDAPEMARMTHELRRAIGVLNAVRTVLEGETQRPQQCGVELLPEVERWAALCAGAGLNFDADMEGLGLLTVTVPQQVLRESLLDCWRALLAHAVPGSRARARLLQGETLQIALAVPDGRRLSSEEQRAFAAPFDLFDTPGYNFDGFVAPPQFVARTMLAAAGVGLHASATDERLELTLTFPAARVC